MTTPTATTPQATDHVTEDLLRMFGIPADEAHQISQRPLPDVGDVPDRDAAA